MRALVRRLILLLAGVFMSGHGAAVNATPAFAFYYGTDIPWESLGAFDVAVVEPGNVGPQGWSHRLNPATEVAAYISVGEVHPTRPYFSKLRPEWKLGANTAWGSVVVDQAAPGWSEFYLAEVMAPLWARGFRTFFLDTMDSFNLVATTPEARTRQAAGLAALVREIKRAYPQSRLVFNRGFEILPDVHTLAWAVAAESLFEGYDAGKSEYRAVPPADREWLLAQLRRCKDEWKLPVIAIDYVPITQRDKARETAQRIRALGFIPWVATPALDSLGVGQVEVLPRQVLAIHDEPGNESEVTVHEMHRVGTLPLNYLGLDVRLVHHASPELTAIAAAPLAGRYAGVVIWFNRGSFARSPAVLAAMNAARAQQVPMVIVGEPPPADVMASLGVDEGATVARPGPLRVEKLSPHVGFEIEPRAPAEGFTPSKVRPGQGDVWLRVHSASHGSDDAIFITPWGGYAGERYFKVELPQDNGERWVVDPVAFFRAALRIDPARPVPDVSTESGRRLLLIHIDGDGFASQAEIPGTPLVADVMANEFLRRYTWPTTVSLIEGETSPQGLYPKLSPQLEATARRIFALPHVEPATHTWSHPFFWADAELGVTRPGRVVSLKLPGYRYDARREIDGSRNYVDSLAGGKKTRLVLWSGDTQPLSGTVAMAYGVGLLNLNGGYTTISRAEPSLTRVGPLGVMKGGAFQVYAPMQNENVYTNNWSGPYYGFERVIETFEMTDLPLRTKPVNLYYHTYIASKRASIASLHKVYGWIQKQAERGLLHPVHAADYAERVLDWRRATVARGPDGSLELRGGKFLREWRVDQAQVSGGPGFAGAATHGAATYLHAPGPTVSYARQAGAPAGFYMESANARLVEWSAQAGERRVRLAGYEPLSARFNAAGCSLQPTAGIRATQRGNWLEIEGNARGETTLIFRCPG